MADKERIDLIKKVYSKTEYPRIIDTSFSELGVTSVSDRLENEFTVEEFFQKYNDLFYTIPAFGDINSHEYLVKTSGEYINFDEDNELIKALQKEITQLRRDLLQAQVEKAEAISGVKLDIDSESIEDAELGNDQFQTIMQELDSNQKIDPQSESTMVGNAPQNPTAPTTRVSSAGGGGMSSGGGSGY